MSSHTPSGLFPSRPPRPTFREPHAVRPGAVLAGAAVAAAWMLFVGLLGASTDGYVWLSLLAGATGWVAAGALARFGDRGVATGAAIVVGLGVAVAVGVAFGTWAYAGFPL